MAISNKVDNHYHLIGIGGIGMSAIAKILLERGFKVSGSDLKDSLVLKGLKQAGACVFSGHNPSNINGAEVVIYSSAIKEDNPEFKAAVENKIRLIKRAEALAQLMSEKIVITVTGSHGKTTTASLVSYLLMEAGFSPTIAIGGILRNIDTNAYFGQGEVFVAEADESDGSFSFYKPTYSIVTNVDYEHLDYYKEFDNLLAAFRDFLRKTEDAGCVFASSDDLALKHMLMKSKKRHVFFGLKEGGADIYPEDVIINGLSSDFDCFWRGNFIERFHLELGGYHNISNALAVIGLGLELGISPDMIKKALANYKGTRRRMDIKLRSEEYLLIDDYAHHPSEIRATLSALKGLGRKRIIVVFQPHRYTRTKLLLEDFGRCFDAADYIVITDIYAASEPPLEGIDAGCIVKKISNYSIGKPVVFMPKEDIVKHVLDIAKPGDLVVTLGAGDITKISDELAHQLQDRVL